METMTAEQALDSVKGITFEKAWAILMEDRKRMEAEHAQMKEEREADRKRIEAEHAQMKEVFMQMKEEREAERKQAEEERKAERARMEEERKAERARMEEERKLKEAEREAERKQREEERKLREAEREAERKVREAEEKQRKIERDKSFKEMQKNLGNIGNTIGDVTEEMFWPKIRKKFYECGLSFDTQTKSKKIYKNNEKVAEIDSILENGSHAMLVEIKTKLSKDDVNYHLKRIERVREYMDILNDNRKLMGAVAGATVSEHVMQYAHNNGLFVLTQSGDAVKVSDRPDDFKAREW